MYCGVQLMSYLASVKFIASVFDLHQEIKHQEYSFSESLLFRPRLETFDESPS